MATVEFNLPFHLSIQLKVNTSEIPLSTFCLIKEEIHIVLYSYTCFMIILSDNKGSVLYNNIYFIKTSKRMIKAIGIVAIS